MQDNIGDRPHVTRRQIFGVTLGNALEFYDFLVFSFFAVQIGQCFFPATNPVSSLLAALATFGAGFLTRPLGAVVIGGLGDRIGRRPMLILSFALIGLSSLGVALIPSYATIGITAPVLVILCRLVQGFALGGEVGASTAFLAEAAPPARRGLFVSLQYVGQYGAVIIAGIIGVALAAMMDDAALASWGWRIAMGIGVLIVPIGLALRGTLPETLDSVTAAEARPPLASYSGVAIFALLTLLANTITTYILNYMTTYAKTVLHLPSNISFGATIAVGIGGVIGALLGGLWSDRHGRRPLMIWPMAAGTLLIMPGFWIVTHFPGGNTLYAVSFVLRMVLAIATTTALISVVEALPPRVRSGALAIAYALAVSIFGGTTQFVVAWLTEVTGDPLAPAWYMLAAAALGLIAMLFARETAPGKTSA